MRYRRLHPFSAPAFAVAHPGPGDRAVTLDVPGYLQVRSYSCGFASTLMVARYFQVDARAVDIFQLLGTDVGGTRQNALVRTLRTLGMSAGVRYDMDFARIARSIEHGKPLIGYLVDDEHWLVIYGYGESPRRVFIADPRPGQRCEQPWSSYGPRLGGFAIVCSERGRRTTESGPDLEPPAAERHESPPADTGVQLELPFADPT